MIKVIETTEGLGENCKWQGKSELIYIIGLKIKVFDSSNIFD